MSRLPNLNASTRLLRSISLNCAHFAKVGALAGAILGGVSSNSFAQPSVAEALRLNPMQKDVVYDQPQDPGACQLSSEKVAGHTAWVVRGPSNELLRSFVDTNDDNKVDVWRYFSNGIEVYRDIDEDFNGKADQYRWFGTAGTRWGLDRDENGKIDEWKVMSPEEVSAEIVEAMKSGDEQRFYNVLIKPNEVAQLGLGERTSKQLIDRAKEAVASFPKVAASQSAVKRNSEWIDFGGLRPGTIPAGTDGSTQDIVVYENVVAMIETDGKPTQVPIGAMVRFGDAWRAIGLAIADENDVLPQSVFFEGVTPQSIEEAEGVSEETTRLVAKLQKIDEQMAKATTPREISAVTELRADTLEKLANAATRTSDREMWWMQFTDTVGTAAQAGNYPKGTRRLNALRKALERNSTNETLLSHVTFTHMSAEYAEQLQQEDADFGEVQERWLVQLEAFLDNYSTSEDAPEAMLQLALAKEFAGEERDANRWYTTIVRDFSDSPLAAKAAGAKRRLECVGKQFNLKGRTVNGDNFDIADLRGNVVLVHYWATWCQPCKQDMEIMKDLKRQFAKEKFDIVGINLDAQPGELSRYFRSEKPRWTHLYEDGGLESRLAAEMGVFTLPVMLLIDERGRVVNRRVHGAQLEKEIKALLD